MEVAMATSPAHRLRTQVIRGYDGDEPGLERVMASLERDRHRHLLAPSSEDDLCRLERAIQRPLPAQYRQFLARLGGGLYYDRHEVFGAVRLMIHDIELVPDVLEVRARIAASCGANGAPFLLPLHRTQATRHWLDVRDGTVGELGAARRFPDLARFLAAVVRPGPEPSRPA
jgi:hypothetical protein